MKCSLTEYKICGIVFEVVEQAVSARVIYSGIDNSQYVVTSIWWNLSQYLEGRQLSSKSMLKKKWPEVFKYWYLLGSDLIF